MGSYTAEMFKKRMRVSRETFEYICVTLAPHIQRQDRHTRNAVPVDTRVSITLLRLAGGDKLSTIADLYGYGTSTVQGIVLDVCAAIRLTLHDMYIKWPSTSQMEEYASEFEAKRGIPYIIGAIDGSHIPIIAPSECHVDYYCRKGFHSCLLQAVVNAKCMIWDYDFGWCGSMNDWNLFERSEIGKRCAAGALREYALLGDAGYWPRIFLMTPYRGHKDGFTREEANWNFIHSSTRMAVERAFGMLKSRFRILLKRIDMKLSNVPPVVSACMVFHNMCIAHGDGFDQIWYEDASNELQREATVQAGSPQRRRQEAACAARNALFELSGVRARNLRQEHPVDEPQDDSIGEFTMPGYKEGLSRMKGLSRSLFLVRVKRKALELFGPESDSTSSSSSTMTCSHQEYWTTYVHHEC